jgi:hypothetical protein
MHSTTERPLQFFFYLLTNYDNYIEVNFYEGYQRNLMVSHIDRENGIIHHTYQDDNADHIQCKEYVDSFLDKKIHLQIEKSKKLIDDNFRMLVARDALYTDYLKLVEKDLIRLIHLSSNLSEFDLSKYLTPFIKDFKNHFKSNINFTKAFLDILRDLESIEAPKNKIILSFQWNQKNNTNLKVLYDKLSNAKPPFIECSLEIFKKAFTKEDLLPHEGIKWLCMNAKNKNQISKVTLIRFIKMLFDKELINNRDSMDSDKIIRNVFLNPEGEQLNNIKGSKQETSRNPSRFDEISKIVNSLTST